MSAFTQRLLCKHERVDGAIHEAVEEAAQAAYVAVVQNYGTREMAQAVKDQVLKLKES
jgi:uncharacterized protein GlcG (DUF336 family)